MGDTGLGSEQRELLKELQTSVKEGLTKEEASKRRQDDGSFNVVDPPLKCPAWVCCLLPCIKSIPSMKKFREIQPEDAEVLRESKWVRYDAASLVRGDIVRLDSGDVVPADCVLLALEEEILVDLRPITGEDKPRSIADNDQTINKLYYGGRILQGSGLAVVTAIGPNTLLASLIARKAFPPKENIMEEEEAGISLVAHGEDRIV